MIRAITIIFLPADRSGLKLVTSKLQVACIIIEGTFYPWPTDKTLPLASGL